MSFLVPFLGKDFGAEVARIGFFLAVDHHMRLHVAFFPRLKSARAAAKKIYSPFSDRVSDLLTGIAMK